MANNVNGKPGLSVNLLPSFYQTPANKKFLQSTIDQLFQPGTLTKVKGYVGRENAKTSTGNDIYIESANQTRQNYQLEPGLAIKDNIGNVTFFKDYQDYINQIKVFGGNTDKHDRLNQQEFYSWDPHINWDMFVNFQNYYWLPYGPETITVYGSQDVINTTYTVEIQTEGSNNQYVFTPNGFTPNPVIKLYKGKTYTFNINSVGNPFSIKTSRSSGAVDRYQYLSAIDNYGVEKGTITFTVPDSAPGILYYQSETDISVGGVIEIFSDNENTSINVTTEILGKSKVILKDGTPLSNGMKIAFGGNVTPASYASDQYYVEGVGTAIHLTPVSVLEILSPWSVTESIPFDSVAFDKEPWDTATGYAGSVDYITINRASRDHNPWSRYNRWFHKDVITTSAAYNNSVVGLDQTLRAVRPIIEFEADIRLFNFGTTATIDIDIFDDTTGNTTLNPNAKPVFTAIEGAAGYNEPTGDVNVALPLTAGMIVLFAGDPDPLVQNKIYRVEYVDVKHINPTNNLPDGSRQLHLVEIATPEVDQVVLVRQGKYQSQMFWFDGTNWIQAQQKLSVNQAPLFDVFDNNNISFSNTSTYNGSTFKGTKLFSYKVGNGVSDSSLGFPLSYQNVNNIGDIVFSFDLASDTFEYKSGRTLQTSKIDIGYLSSMTYAGTLIYENGWQTCTTSTVQAAVRIYKNSGLTTTFQLDIFDDYTNLDDLVLKVYINGIRLSSVNWSLIDSTPYKKIKLKTPIVLTDVLTVRAFASQSINSNGYYEIPFNLQNNPLNNSMSDFTLGEVIDHVNSIVDNIPGFTGVFPGNSILRDLGNITQYGTKFVQHSGPLSLGLYHITSETNNIIKAVQQSRNDYNNFKRLFVDTASNLGKDGDSVTIVNLILQKINANKPNTAPYYFSDMVPYGACVVTNLSVVDYRIRQYPLSAVFTLDVLSNKAVGIYLNGVQLIYGQDYTFNNQGFVVIDSGVKLNNGDTISTYEYDSTDGSFVPATPSKLGMWPVYTPKIYLDTTLVNPQNVIQGHDGSIVLAYNDYRDALLLELEKRIFNNIKVKYDTDIFDIAEIMPSYNRSNSYSRTEFNSVLAPNFYKWTNLIGKDLTTPLNYDRTNTFTYNYSKNSAPDGKSSLPGYWRGIYRWILDTDRPNICPWEMLGFTIQPAWWTDIYGPAPYTSDNLPMWQDIANGAIREPGQPVTYSKKYAKSFLLGCIPVDENGDLISPQLSGIATGTINPSIDNNFVFGDGSPVETAWTRSSYYPFSVLISSILLTPAKTFGLLLDRSRIKRNLAGQLIYTNTELRIRPADVILPSVYSSKTRVQTAGFVNYIVDLIFNYIFSNNVAGYNSYSNDLLTMQPQLSYRLGAFTNKSQFNFLLESKTPSSTGNVFIPTDDYTIFLNKSTSIKKLTYSGVIVTKLSTGFEVKGYSITQPYFNYYSPKNTGTTINVGGISENYSNWTSGENYVLGYVVHYNGVYYRTTVTHISLDSFNTSYFSALASLPMIGGVSANIKTSWDRNVINVAPYGTLFSKIQDVVDFLLGYGEYLKDQGFLFDDFNRNLSAVANWETSAKEFLFWTTQNWSTGQDKWSNWEPNQTYNYGTIVRYEGDYYSALFNIPSSTNFDYTKWSLLPGLSNIGSSVISLSPSANGINFIADLAVVDSITSGFHPYEIFKVDGTAFEVSHIDSYRQENTVTYSPRTTDGIYGAAFYLVQNEHVVLINNTTIFNDIIYSPTSGYRQERLKISGYTTINWYGGLDIPGFIFDAAAIQSWMPYQDYNIGDIIAHQSYYYSATKFLSGSPTFVVNEWNLLPKQPTSQILPNWTNIATQFTDFYSLEVDSFNSAQQSIAHHLIGYQKRQYLDNIIQDDVSEFKFYQGMIREKGTQNVLNKLFNVLSSDSAESLVFYEEWALRVAQYGASNAFENIEFNLNQSNYARNNSQATVLINKLDSTISPFVIQQSPSDVYLKPSGYNSNPFPLQNNFKSFLRSAGYVNSLDVKLAIKDLSSLLSQSVTQLETGITYKILTIGNTDFTQLGALSNTIGLVFTASSSGIGTGTVSVDANQFTEGDYIWCSFDNTVVTNSWNVYRFTDINIRVTDLNYTNNVLTITCKNLIKNVLVGDYVGIILNYPVFQGLNNFYQVTSVKLNSFTVAATVSGLPSTHPFQYSAELIVYALVTTRALSIDNADLVILANPKNGDIIWTDDRGDGNWASWKYNSVYTKYSAANKNAVSNFQFGKNIAINRIGTLATVGSSSGQISTYDKIGRSVAWTHRQYLQAPFIAHSNANPDYVIATVIAMSPSGQWLATGSPLAGYASTRYVGVFDSAQSYDVGDIVSYSDVFYQALLDVPIATTPSNVSVYWKTIFYVPVDSLATNSSLSNQGVITLYQKDSNNNYILIDTIVSPYPADNENFGSSLVFDETNLYIGASGSENSAGKVYKLTYNILSQVSTYYDDVNSNGITLHVTSTAGISAGQFIQGTGFTSGQTVNAVLTRLMFLVALNNPNYILDNQNNLVNISFITTGTKVAGYNIPDNTQVVQSGIDISGNIYVLVKSDRDLAQTIATVQFVNIVISAEFAVNAVSSDSTIILSAKPDSVPTGQLTFVSTSWRYDYTSTLSGEADLNYFGSNLSLSTDGNTLLVSATGGEIGAVYIYKDLGSGFYLNKKLSGGDNDYGLGISVSNSGNYIAVTDILYAEDGVAHHGLVSVYAFTDNNYIKIQDIRDHFVDTGNNFGNKVSFMNDDKTLVIYSENAAGPQITSFDKSSTSFDKSSTNFVMSLVGSGRIDVYDKYNTNWIFSETIANPDEDFDGFGSGFAVGANSIFAGAPLATVAQQAQAGIVYFFNKNKDAYSWTQTNVQSSVVDISRLKKSFLYNKSTNQLITYLDVIDPIQGKIAGPAEEELKYKTFYDPAIYSYSDGTVQVTVSNRTYWSKNQLGQLWWDLRTAKFVDPYFNNALYRSNNWNSLAPGASIDIYEWVTSSLLPALWDVQADTAAGTALGISGTSLYGNSAYTVRQRYNSVTKKFVNIYYFWVKNKKIIPNIPGRNLSAQGVSKLISSPLTQGYTYLSLIGADSYNLSNAYQYLINDTTTLSIEYWTTDSIHRNIHSQWKLISTDTIVDLPHTIEQKWIDSLCGSDSFGRVVPDPELPPKLKYGVENRPRQGMFVNRVEALKEFAEATNVALLQNQIVESYNIGKLESYDTPPTKISGLYDSVLDTDAEIVYANVNLFQRPTITPIITNGKITGITVVKSGKGYLIAPYIKIIGSGEGAVVRAVVDALGRIVSAIIENAGYGYDTNTVCQIRDYCVLISSDTQANGVWSIYSYDPTYVNPTTKELTGIWSRILTQSYDVRNYWNYADWYGSYTDASGNILFTATQFTAADFSVKTYADLNSISANVGQIVKVLTVNTGGWQLLYKYANSTTVDWTRSYSVVGIQNGTIQLSSNLYESSSDTIGYDASIYDNSAFDIKASGELRIILNTLKNNIFINDLKATYLDLFFNSVRYAHSEQLYLDWIFKTSFVRATHNVGTLGQPVYYPIDNISNFQDYIAEVKPYKTKIREYISNYTSLDTEQSVVTDFDLPPIFANNAVGIIDTQIVDEVITANHTLIRSYPWKFWLDNTGYSVIELKIIDGGSGYVSQPRVTITSSSGTGATAQAFLSQNTGSVNRLILLTSGSGYLSSPTVTFNGGLAQGGIPARAAAIIGNGLVRNNLIGIKFDRLTYKNCINSLDVVESFTGSGSRFQFPLNWAPDIKIGQSSVYIDNNLVLRELYAFNIVSTTVNGYTQYSGTLTFTTAPSLSSSIVVNYKKDISLLNAADRIEFFYNPVSGELGKDLNQLMTGIDYGGTIVGNLGFDVSKGWNDTPYSSGAWDIFDPSFNDYIVTVAANTYTFQLPYLPAIGTEINVYYIPLSITSTPGDGVSLIYPYDFNVGLTTVSVTTVVQSVSADNIYGIVSLNNSLEPTTISINLQSVLTSTSGAAGQDIIEFFQVSNLFIGQFVSGHGVATNSKITFISDNFVTISNNLSDDAVGNYNFFTLGTELSLVSTSGILPKMSIIGTAFTTQTVSKIVNSTTLVLSSPPNLIPIVGEVLDFTDNVAGSKILKVSSVSNLQVNDVVTCNQTGIFGVNTKVISIDLVNSSVTLNQIMFRGILNNIDLTFTRILLQPIDVIVYPNGTAVLTSPVLIGSTVNIYGKTDPIRLDADDFDPVAEVSPTNPYAVMQPIVIGTTQPPVLVKHTFANNTNVYIITVPQLFTVNFGDTFIIRQSTSDGSVIPSDYDSDISGGDLAYSSARGILADDIVVDGDGFTTPNTSPAPEEVVPGQVVDTLAIKVFDRPTSGNANIIVENFITDGVSSTFSFKEIPSSFRSVIVKLNNIVKTFTDDYTINYSAQTITFNSTPVSNQIVTIFIVGYAGENILDIEYFIGDGSTKEFVTTAPWLTSVSALVYVDGVPSSYTLFKTDNTYDLNNAVGIRFDNAPSAGALINYIIVSGLDVTFSVTRTERIATDGNTTYKLQNFVGNSLPNESNMIVRVDQTILEAPISNFYTIGSNRLTYNINSDRVSSYSVSENQIIVIIGKAQLVIGRDYTVDLAGVSIKITRETYKKYSGEQMSVHIFTNQAYMYDAATGKIVFPISYDSSHVVEVISSYRQEYLDMQRTEITAQSLLNIIPDLAISYQYQNVIGGYITLDRSVINENYIWVLKNSILLTPGVDYILNNARTNLQLTHNLSANDKITLMTFGSNILKPGIAYMQFKDMLNRKSYIRLSQSKQTTLAVDLYWNSTEIVLADATNFQRIDSGQKNAGVIEIRGERIEYFSKIGNTLRLLRRGTMGTGINHFNSAGTFVQDISASETIPYKDSSSTTAVVSNGTNIVPLSFAPKLYPIKDATTGEVVASVPGDIEVFVGGYDNTAIWSTNVDYTEGTIVNVGTYTYRCIVNHTSSNNFSTDSSNWVFFIGNIRLKKQPYKVFNVNKMPYSPDGDIDFSADFEVDGVSNQLTLTNLLSIGTRITVIKNTGIEWDSKTNILDDNSKVAQFIKAQPGIWYSEYKK